MPTLSQIRTALLCLCLSVSLVPAARAAGEAPPRQVTGTFDVKVVPQGTPQKLDGATLGRMSLDKSFHGALEAVGKGEMLTAGTDVPTSAGYVAIEHVSGTLQGRKGSFVLQHTGSMNCDGQHMLITVVPDSGTGQLKGIAGKMAIRIVDKQHFYDFDYTLPDAR